MYDDDGIDAPFERAMNAQIRRDARDARDPRARARARISAANIRRGPRLVPGLAPHGLARSILRFWASGGRVHISLAADVETRCAIARYRAMLRARRG